MFAARDRFRDIIVTSNIKFTNQEALERIPSVFGAIGLGGGLGGYLLPIIFGVILDFTGLYVPHLCFSGVLLSCLLRGSTGLYIITRNLVCDDKKFRHPDILGCFFVIIAFYPHIVPRVSRGYTGSKEAH